MKRAILLFAALLGAVLMMASPAKAGSVSGFTLLTTTEWTPMPNATNRVCTATGCTLQFRWTGTPPGKDTTIRVVDGGGNEFNRLRIPGGSSGWWSITNMIGSQEFRVQGRMPTESGNMANFHFFDYRW